MPGYSEFKEGTTFPNDGRVTVIGGVDGSGLVVPLAATASGGQGSFVESSGNLDMTSAASALTVDCDGASSVCVQFTRTAQTGSIQVQGSVDGTNFEAFNVHRRTGSGPSAAGSASVDVTTGSATLIAPVHGFKKVRVIVSSTGTGSLPVIINASSQVPGVLHGIMPGTGAVNLGKSEDAAHTSGDVGVMALAVRNDTNSSAFAGTNFDYCPISVTNRGAVHSVLVSESGNTGSPVRLEDDALASASGTLVVGSQSATSITSDVGTSGDLAFLKSDMLGRLHVNPYGAAPGQFFNAVSAAETGTGDRQIVAAGAANVRHYVTDLIIVNRSANASEISIKDGTTVVLRAHVGANSSKEISLKTPIRGTAATALNFAMTTTATDTIVTALGFSVID